jgi:predicted DNA-binding protein
MNQQAIQIPISPEIAQALQKKALTLHQTETAIALSLIEFALEQDEDCYFSKLAQDIERKNKKWIPHEQAWG